MSMSKKLLRLLGIILGAAMLAAGVLGAMFLSRPKPAPMARVAVRPVKTMLVGGPVPVTQRKYPGKVQAATRVQLSFDVAGTIDDLLVVNGQKVRKDEILAKLDPRDYQNAYDAKKAIENECRVEMERESQLFSKGVASKSEFDLATAKYDVAKSNSLIAKKALEDAVIRAPFDGIVAYTIAKQHQNVAAKEAVMSLQDPSKLEIVIQVPEQTIAMTAPKTTGRTFTASFDYLPGREFPMTVKEYATEADLVTQTYAVTLAMPAPEDVSILPGMSATVTVATPPLATNKSEGYLLPVTAVPSDGQGKFFVWIVEPGKDGLDVVRRQDVTVGPLTKEFILVLQGVTSRQRIVTAGVHLLEDGQQVRLLAPEAKEAGT